MFGSVNGLKGLSFETLNAKHLLLVVNTNKEASMFAIASCFCCVYNYISLASPTKRSNSSTSTTGDVVNDIPVS